MSSREPFAAFSRDGKPAATKSLVFLVVFGPIAFFTGDSVASALGTDVVVGQVLLTVVPTVLVMALAYKMGGRGSVEFYDDSVRLRDRRIPYDDVDLAVREDESFGTATFKLVVLGETTMTLRYVRNPDEVGRLLAQHLPAPADQLAQAPPDGERATDGAERMEAGWQFWEYWRADEPLPETALVEMSRLKGVLDVGAVDPNRLDRVDMRDATGLSDIDKNDVTSSSNTSAGAP